MKIGYARVSTSDQNLVSLVELLRKAGWQKIFQDIACGAKAERSGSDDLMQTLRPGDMLMINKPDRLGRSLRRLVELVTR